MVSRSLDSTDSVRGRGIGLLLRNAFLGLLLGTALSGSSIAIAPPASDPGVSEKGLTGVVIGWRSKGPDALPYVQAVLTGSPAEAAGIRNGDIYTHVNGHPLKGLDQDQAMKIIRGGAGTTMRLRVLRPGEEKALYFTITREPAKAVRSRDRSIHLPR